jgi:hypothetical protein
VSNVVDRAQENPVLSEEEIEELRARVRKQLAEEEAKRDEARARAAIDRSVRTRRVREIEQDEEERFYRERGYRRFIDRAGNAKWLNPEQYARWEEERARQLRRKRDPRYHMRAKSVRKTVVIIVAVGALILLMVFLAILRRG